MSDRVTTEKKTDKEKTVKKRAGKSLVAPVKYKPAEGKPPRQSLELTAPIGLTWNEDAVKPAESKARPMVGTGWPDRPPTPKVPLKPVFSSGKAPINTVNTTNSAKGPVTVQSPVPVNESGGKQGRKLQAPKNEESVISPAKMAEDDRNAPIKKGLPVFKEAHVKEETGAGQEAPVINTASIQKGQTGNIPSGKAPAGNGTSGKAPQGKRPAGRATQANRPSGQGQNQGPQGRQGRQAPGQAQGRPGQARPGQPRQGQAGQQRPTAPRNGQAGNPANRQPAGKPPVSRPPVSKPPVDIPEPISNEPRVLYSPVNIQDEPVQISPMQKRPVSTASTWQGPIQQLPGYPGDPGMGPKFVRTVVTTTTTTYEPVTEDVIRQITSQTAPMALTEQVLNQQPAIAATGQPVQPVQQPVQQSPARQAPVRTGGQQQGRQQRPGQGQARPGQPRQGQARPQARPGQPMQQGGQRPGMQQQGQRPGMQQGRPVNGQTGPMGQQARPGQGPAGVQRPTQGQGGSIIGAMEARGPKAQPNKPKTMMDRQLEEIEKALGLNENTQGSALGQAVMPGQGPAGIVIPQAPTGPSMTTPVTPPLAQPPAAQPPAAKPPVPIGMTINDPETEKKKSAEYMMLFVEGIIFVIVLAICISIYQKIKKGRPAETPVESAYEETQEPPESEETTEEVTGDEGTEDFEVEDAGSEDILSSETGDSADAGSVPSGSVDVENDDFTLRCTNVTVKLDTEGNPAALIFFTFSNKTSDQLSLADVFPISVTQNGEVCDTFAALDEYPEEYYNKDMQIADGSELSCAYAVSLKDAVSPIVLTVNNSRDGLSEVGSTEIAIQ